MTDVRVNIDATQLTPLQNGGLAARTDSKRVQWIAKSNSFQITYTRTEGSKKRSIKGLKVHRRNAANEWLDDDAYRKVYQSVLARAKLAWNSHDQSEEDRCDIPLEA